MTREEAIKRLKEYAAYSYGIWHGEEEDTKAFDMAIEALSAERTGEWVKVIDEETHNVVKWHYECNQCGARLCEKGQHYCNQCGAKMGGDTE